jgi:hypothetical protein
MLVDVFQNRSFALWHMLKLEAQRHHLLGALTFYMWGDLRSRWRCVSSKWRGFSSKLHSWFVPFPGLMPVWALIMFSQLLQTLQQAPDDAATLTNT